jgi:hypothetical protein
MTRGATCASHRDYGRATLFLRGLGLFSEPDGEA